LDNALGISTGPFPSFGTVSGGTRYNNNLLRGYASLENTNYEAIIDLGTNVDDVWLHFDMQGDNNSTILNTIFVAFYGSSKNLLHGIVGSVTSATGQFNLRPSTDGSTFATAYSGTTFSAAYSTLNIVDVHLKIASSGGLFEVYHAGTLVSSFSGDTTANGSNLIRFIRLGSGTSNGLKRPSGIIVASESTIGWKAQELYPITGTQDHSGWTGDFSVLDDYGWSVTKSDSAFANSNNATSSYVTSDTHASVSTLVPAALVVSARAFNTVDSSVTGLELGVSIGGTYYGSGVTDTLTPEDGDTPLQHIFTANPSNSSAWTHADFDALQLAIRAKT
jgi:hypothetical protein